MVIRASSVANGRPIGMPVCPIEAGLMGLYFKYVEGDLQQGKLSSGPLRRGDF